MMQVHHKEMTRTHLGSTEQRPAQRTGRQVAQLRQRISRRGAHSDLSAAWDLGLPKAWPRPPIAVLTARPTVTSPCCAPPNTEYPSAPTTRGTSSAVSVVGLDDQDYDESLGEGLQEPPSTQHDARNVAFVKDSGKGAGWYTVRGTVTLPHVPPSIVWQLLCDYERPGVFRGIAASKRLPQGPDGRIELLQVRHNCRIASNRWA
jgi:hypothetical protein